MNRKKPLKPERPGFAIAMALVALLILLATGAGLLSIGMHNRVFATRTSTDIAARCAADAGITKACIRMNKKLGDKIWDDSILPYAHHEALSSCDATFSYKVTVDSNSVYYIGSTGFSGQSQKDVRSTLRLKGLFDYAVFTEGGITLRNGVKINGYNSNDGPYGGTNSVLPVTVGTNSTAAGAIDFANSAGVIGDVVVGAGSDPLEVIDGDLNEITGDAYPAIEPRELDPIKPPTLVYQGVEPVGTITQSGKYDTIVLGEGEKLVIEGNVSLHVTNDVILGNSAIIEITEGSSLELYLGGNFSSKNSSEINNLTKLPSALKIYGTSTTPVDYHFYANTDFQGVVYAPNSAVHLNNSAAVYGAIVADSLRQDVSANIYYDHALQDVTVDDLGVYFVIDRWGE